MHNVVKWPNILTNILFTPQDFQSMFGHFATLCMKGLKPVFVIQKNKGVYSEPCQTSKMELFMKIIDG